MTQPRQVRCCLAQLNLVVGDVDGNTSRIISAGTEAREGPIDQVPHLVLVAHIRAEELSFSAERAQLSHEFLAGFLVATGNNGAMTFPRESPRRRTPDSSKRAGDQDTRSAHGPVLPGIAVDCSSG